MIRVTVVILLLIVLCASASFAGGSAIAGKWSCVSNDERGTEVAFTLAVKDDGGKLAGSLTILQSGDEIELIEPALTGSTFTFKIRINAEEVVDLTAHIDGAKIQGSFKGKASGTGTFKGTRQD